MDRNGQYDSEKEMNDAYEWYRTEARKKHKLSDAQKTVIDTLKYNDCFIARRLLKKDFKIIKNHTGAYGDEYVLSYFPRSTFDVLFKLGYIETSEKNHSIFILNIDL